MKLFLDDVRRPPGPDWVHARTAAEAIALLADAPCQEARLDNDLFDDLVGGLAVVEWMARTGRWPTHAIEVHTSNRTASMRMCAAIDRSGLFERRPGEVRKFVRVD